MPKNDHSTDRPRERGLAGTAFDLTVGGALLAADKAADMVDSALEKGSEVVGEAGETLRSAKDALVDSTEEAVAEGRTAAESAATKARRSARRVTGAPNATPYESRTKDELYRLARERDIDGRSRMTKRQLIQALRTS